MGTYEKRYFPYCGYELHSYRREFFAIGNPFIKCPNCNREIKLDCANEWKLMSFWKKLKWFFKYFLGGLLLHTFSWAFPSYILTALVIGFISPNMAEKSKDLIMNAVLVIFLLIGFIRYTYIYGYEAIKKSNERMKDSDYAQRLKDKLKD